MNINNNKIQFIIEVVEIYIVECNEYYFFFIKIKNFEAIILSLYSYLNKFFIFMSICFTTSFQAIKVKKKKGSDYELALGQ